MTRVILHADMDCFYAAIEQRDHPDYIGKPVIVGAAPGKRGVVSAASYEARQFGIHSAMPINQAFQRCPHGIFLAVDMKKYASESGKVMQLLSQFTPHVEQISVDEAFLDITGTERLFGAPWQVAQKIKKKIFQMVQLTVSIGIAPNKFVAKLASDLEKPNGLVMVRPDQVKGFLATLSVSRVWGVGKKTGNLIKKMGIKTIGELAAWPKVVLQEQFGKWGEKLYLLAQGIDDREVNTQSTAKSISQEHTFMQDVADAKVIQKKLLELSEKVARRLRRHGLKGHTITFVFRDQDFKKSTRSKTLSIPTNLSNDIYRIAIRLFQNETDDKRYFRLVGVKVSNFSVSEETCQISLFEENNMHEKYATVASAVDEVQNKFGVKAITKGSLLQKDN